MDTALLMEIINKSHPEGLVIIVLGWKLINVLSDYVKAYTDVAKTKAQNNKDLIQQVDITLTKSLAPIHKELKDLTEELQKLWNKMEKRDESIEKINSTISALLARVNNLEKHK